jgi:hypothetical protein
MIRKLQHTTPLFYSANGRTACMVELHASHGLSYTNFVLGSAMTPFPPFTSKSCLCEYKYTQISKLAYWCGDTLLAKGIPNVLALFPLEIFSEGINWNVSIVQSRIRKNVDGENKDSTETQNQGWSIVHEVHI